MQHMYKTYNNMYLCVCDSIWWHLNPTYNLEGQGATHTQVTQVTQMVAIWAALTLHQCEYTILYRLHGTWMNEHGYIELRLESFGIFRNYWTILNDPLDITW